MSISPQQIAAPTGAPQQSMISVAIDQPVNNPQPPPPKRKKPAPDLILSRMQDAVNQWKIRDQRMDEDLTYYRLQIGSTDSAGNTILRNTPRVMVDKAAIQLNSSNPIYDVAAPRAATKEQVQAMRDTSKYMMRSWSKTWRNSGKNDLIYDMTHYGAGTGWCAVRLQYNPTPAEGKPPVKARIFESRQVYPVWDEDDLKYVVHEYRQTIAQALSAWPVEVQKMLQSQTAAGSNSERPLTDQVTVKAYYDDWWFSVYVDDQEVVKPTDHQYGFVPWVIGVAPGSPIEATDTDQTNWPEFKGLSIFDSIKIAYDYENKMLSIMADEIEKQVNPTIIHHVEPGNKEEREEIVLEPGVINYVFTNEDVKPLVSGIAPQTISPLMDALSNDQEKGGIPSSMWALGNDVGASGFAMSISQGAARDSLQGLFDMIAYMQEEMLRKAFTLIRDKYPGEVGYLVQDRNGNWLAGDSINATDIEAVGTTIIVSYKDIAPKDELQWANLAIALVDKKLVSMETARERYLGLDNPFAEDDKVISELALMNQQVLDTYIIPKVLARLDPQMAQAFQQQQQMQQMQQQQGPPGGGPPQPGGGPPQGPPPGPGGPPPGMHP